MRGRPAARPRAWGPRPSPLLPRPATAAEGVRVANLTIPAAAAAANAAKLARLEAALVAADRALSARKLAEVARLVDRREAERLLSELNAGYDAAGMAFRCERVARGYRLLTRRRLAPWLERLHARPPRHDLSAPVLETLTVVAYRQPCTRADVDAVRGVSSADLLKQLLDKQLIRIAGEDPSLGRPFLYGTTGKFLETFGLKSLAGLPEVEGLPRPG